VEVPELSANCPAIAHEIRVSNNLRIVHETVLDLIAVSIGAQACYRSMKNEQRSALGQNQLVGEIMFEAQL